MSAVDPPRQVGELARRLASLAPLVADVLAEWWLGFGPADYVAVDEPPADDSSLGDATRLRMAQPGETSGD